jgi:hypothetical protein
MTAPATLACPRCATPLVTLAQGASIGRVAVQCTRCGHWLTLGQDPAASPAGAAGWPAPAPTSPPVGQRWTPLPPGLGAGPARGTPGGMGMLEWMAAAAGLLGGLLLAVLGAALGSFRATLAGLGGDLPRLTAFVFSTRLPYLLAALAIALAAGGVLLRQRGLLAGRALLAAAVLITLVGAPICIISLYLPIFSLADAVK